MAVHLTPMRVHPCLRQTLVSRVICFSLVVLFLLPGSAYAYLDAGTGSMIIQMLIAGVAAGLVVIRTYWSRIRRFFGSEPAEPGEDAEEHGDS